MPACKEFYIVHLWQIEFVHAATRLSKFKNYLMIVFWCFPFLKRHTWNWKKRRVAALQKKIIVVSWKMYASSRKNEQQKMSPYNVLCMDGDGDDDDDRKTQNDDMWKHLTWNILMIVYMYISILRPTSIKWSPTCNQLLRFVKCMGMLIWYFSLRSFFFCKIFIIFVV